ncbi:MAG: triose-phosphate isomerase [Ignavibacteria bacterium]|nr:triose-phosphate isomerase [Ignavibacteria bacterium]
MRKKFVAGNWKMNKNIAEAADLMKEIKENLKYGVSEKVETVICPPYLSLQTAGEIFAGSKIGYGAQNMHSKDDGAFTGEISGRMLKDAGCRYVILGHSERRQFFNETNHLINLKVIKALESGLFPILCVGETLEQREEEIHKKIVDEQVTLCLKGVSEADAEKIIIAYEPVWAIGTGKTATSEQAEEMHVEIRNSIANLYNISIAGNIRILYGGSVNDANAKELFSMPDIDGGLIGGASLKAAGFIKIIESALQ